MRNNRIIVFVLAIFTIGCTDPEIDITKHEFYPIPDSEIEMAIDSIGTFPEIIPIREGRSVRELIRLEGSIRSAIQDRDTSFIYELLSDSINLSFGGHWGKSDFRDLWHLERDSTEFWEEFGDAFYLGGYFNEDSSAYTFPYMFGHMPQSYDFFFSAVGALDHVGIYQQPNDTTLFYTTGYTVFEVTPSSMTQEEFPSSFISVMITDQYYAYVKSNEIRSALDYRGRLEKRNGDWKLLSWIAGD